MSVAAEHYERAIRALVEDRERLAVRAYIAGLLDGEGYIGAKRRLPTARNRMTSPKYSVAVSVDMTDEAPVRFVAAFCDREHLVSCRTRQAHHKPIYGFQVENTLAVALLREVLPHLICKRQQAVYALELADLREQSARSRTKVLGTHTHTKGPSAGRSYRVFGLSDEYVAACDTLYASMLRTAPRSGNGARFRAHG